MSMKQTIVALAVGITWAMGAQAQCLSDGDVGVMASHYASKTPSPNFPALSDADALTHVSVKPNFRALGKRFGKQTPAVAAAIAATDAAALKQSLQDGAAVVAGGRSHDRYIGAGALQQPGGGIGRT